jgi:hypothetical protein
MRGTPPVIHRRAGGEVREFDFKPATLQAPEDFLSKVCLCEVIYDYVILMVMNFRVNIALCPEGDIVYIWTKQ